MTQVVSRRQWVQHCYVAAEHEERMNKTYSHVRYLIISILLVLSAFPPVSKTCAWAGETKPAGHRVIVITEAMKTPDIEIIESGIFSSADLGAMTRKTMPTGNITVRRIELVKKTARIPAVLGVMFGVRYRLKGLTPGERVQIAVKVRMPEEKKLAQGSKEFEQSRKAYEEVSITKTIGEVTFDGFLFKKNRELVPGTWAIELLCNGIRIGEQSFEVYNAEKGVDTPVPSVGGKETPIQMNNVYKDGHTAVYHALKEGKAEAAKKLFAHGAEFNKEDKKGSFFLLDDALRGRDLHLFKILLDKKLDPNAKNLFGDRYEHSILLEHLHNLVAVELLLTHGADPNTDAIAPIYLLLSDTAISNNERHEREYQVINLLLKYGADPNRSRVDGESPLVLALKTTRWDVVKLLLDHKVNVNVVDKDGNPALFYSFRDQTLRTAEALLKLGADPNKTFADGDTPLTKALKMKAPVKIPELLLSCGANPNSPDNTGTAPLINAVKNNDVDIVQLLIKNGANANCKDTGGNPALLLAVQSNPHRENTPKNNAENLNIVKTLLDHGADPNIGNSRGVFPLEAADAQGAKDKIDLLLNHNADKNLARKGKVCGIWLGTFPDNYQIQLMVSLDGNFGASATRGKDRYLFKGSWELHDNELILEITQAASREQGNYYVRDHSFVRRVILRYATDNELSLNFPPNKSNVILKIIRRHDYLSTQVYWD